MPPLSIFRNVRPKCFNKRTFSDTGRSRYANPNRFLRRRVWQTSLNNRLGHDLMLTAGAFDKRNRLAQHNAVAAQNAFYIRRY